MSADDRWLLPEGVEEILPPEAHALEAMRRRLLDLFHGWGYEQVMPPLVEFLESLQTGLGQDLDLQTFKLTDQLSGRLMGLRADMTPQVARIEAHYLRRRGPVRLCYLGPVLRTRPGVFGASREPLQLGAELFGHPGPAADAEVIELMARALEAVGVGDLHLSLGHVGVYRALAGAAGLPAPLEASVFDALRRRSRPDLQAVIEAGGVAAPYDRLLPALLELNGGPGVIDEARAALAEGGEAAGPALDNLAAVVAQVGQVLPELRLYLDLADLRGYRYHTGTVFSAYAPGSGQAIAHGGRYDDIGRAFGYARPATGFSMDLRLVLRLAGTPPPLPGAILAPAELDTAGRAEVARLRAAGERVVAALPGAEAPAGCDRRLVRRDGRWQVLPLAG